MSRSQLSRSRTRWWQGWGRLVLVLGTAVAGAPVVWAEVAYPGVAVGAFTCSRSGQSITLSNQAIAATWRFDGGSLRAPSIRDVQARTSLMFTGEVFQIVLTDGQRYQASSLTAVGKPQVRKVSLKSKAARLAARLPGQAIELSLHSADGRLRVVWRVIALAGANYLRQELEATATGAALGIQEVIWLNEAVPGARVAGRVDGSPVVAGDFFFGCEDPLAENQAGSPLSGGEGVLRCRVKCNAPLRKGETLTQSCVIGVAPAGQMRRAFLYYLERERAHPYRPFLHYNSWYDLSSSDSSMNETNCVEVIRRFGENLVEPYGAVMDALVFDDGWDDPHSLWQFHRGFPRGFEPLAQACRPYRTRVGVWLSPFGGYGEPKKQRLEFGRAHGYETNRTGFSLAGPKYYAAFKTACVNMMSRYGVNHFKFDGIAAGMYASGAAEYVRDLEALRQLMLELRRVDPAVYINFTTGSWPSPFWLRYADSLWRQGDDMGFTGKGNQQQQWLTYRDREVLHNIVGKGPLYPLNALMTQGVAWSRRGTAAKPDFNAAGFKDDVRAFFGAGTSLQELYVQPGRLKAQDWRVLAEAAKWSRAHAGVLADTHWIGGDPGKLEVYGYASWTPRKGIVMLRNPDDQPREFALDLGTAFELPPGAPTSYSLKSPWAEAVAQPARTGAAGRPLPVTLQPFEVLVLEAVPSL